MVNQFGQNLGEEYLDSETRELPPTNLNAILLAPILESMSKSLTDMSRRNRQINYQPRKVGTLDLEFAENSALKVLRSGLKVKLSNLFPVTKLVVSSDDAEMSDEVEIEPKDPTLKVNAEARKSARRLYDVMRELAEEKGLDSLFLASGCLRWTSDEGNEHRAPIFISQANITPVDGKRTDFFVSVDFASGAEINPSLIDYLILNKGLVWDEEHWATQLQGDNLEQITNSKNEFLALIRDVLPDASFEELEVLDTFFFAKAPMVRDLRDPVFLELASSNAIILAATNVDETLLDNPEISEFDYVDIDLRPVVDTPLILDADSHQQVAIEMALRGQNLVIQGPPGTGKSQTIANLIAALAEQGKRVLFVAEKAAAIEAVAKRLDENGLGHLMLRLHESGAKKSATYNQLKSSIDKGQRLADSRQDVQSLTYKRQQLNERSVALHEPLDALDLSPFQLIELASAADVDLNISDPNTKKDLKKMSILLINNGIYAEKLASKLSQSGYLDTESKSSKWNLARPIPGLDLDEFKNELNEICLENVRLTELKGSFPQILKEFNDIPIEELNIYLAATINHLEAEALLAFPLEDQLLATFLAAFKIVPRIKKASEPLGWFQSLSLRRKARRYLPGIADVKSALQIIEEARIVWKKIGKATKPKFEILSDLHALNENVTNTQEALKKISVASCDHLKNGIAALDALKDFSDAWRAQIWYTNELDLLNVGLKSAIFPLFASGLSQESCKKYISATAAAAFVNSLLNNESSLSMLNVSGIVDSYASLDRKFIAENAQRIAVSCATQSRNNRNTFTDQNKFLGQNIDKKTRQASTRELFHRAPDIITSITPCIAMSPLLVSTLLPIKEMFDVVIFDEASQVLPADALPAIVRGRQLVVAGDSRQLPPTTFFDSVASDGMAVVDDYESILDRLASLLPSRSLLWHYRSLDERLIAVSNQHIYDGQLTTFPGAERSETIKFVQALETNTALIATSSSNSHEIDLLISEIFNHASNFPQDSLGVITLGREHSNRVEMAFRNELSKRPDLLNFFSGESSERFFIKNLERVQGDERDNIIITTGYQKNQSGKLPQNFGPINQNGGQRRLNVAMSRARKRMTLVSSFNSSDIDASTKKRGVEVLHAFFTFMESGGTNLLTGRHGEIPLNPFESAILESLTARGLTVEPQLGVSGYRIDFAIRHPILPGRYILAVEADGASYHSEKSARDRDRLRQEHLERLGWKFHRIWSTDWFRNPTLEIDRLVEAYEKQLQLIDSGQTLSRGHVVETTHVKSLEVITPEIQRSLSSFNIYGKSIAHVPRVHLDSCMQHVMNVNGIITRDEAIEEARKALGYSRKGPAIVSALAQSYDRVQAKRNR
jgi:very-short-patch-repair endonuclease